MGIPKVFLKTKSVTSVSIGKQLLKLHFDSLVCNDGINSNTSHVVIFSNVLFQIGLLLGLTVVRRSRNILQKLLLLLVITFLSSTKLMAFDYLGLKSGISKKEAREILDKNYPKVQVDDTMFIAYNAKPDGKTSNMISLGFQCKNKLTSVTNNFDTNATLREYMIIAATLANKYGSHTLLTSRSEYMNSEIGEAKSLYMSWLGKNEIILSATTYDQVPGNISVTFKDTSMCK